MAKAPIEEVAIQLKTLDVVESRINASNGQGVEGIIDAYRQELLAGAIPSGVDKETDAVLEEKRALTPKQLNEAISALKRRFNEEPEGYERQEGINFAIVEKSLRADVNKEAVWALYNMVQEGSHPDVLEEDDGTFLIGETFSALIAGRANCVYDDEAEKLIGSANCNGNAVGQAMAKGYCLMEPRVFSGKFKPLPSGRYCFDYLHTEPSKRKNGGARFAYRDFGESDVDLGYARSHYDGLGWRGALRVQKVS